MIFDREPSTWQELQNFVAQVFTEIGCDAKIEHSLTTVRGSINIDVYVEDKIGNLPLIYLCECKHWNSRVPKSIVHSFRSVVSDVGANRGLIISKTGFQAGAFQAAEHSIIELLTWDAFQKHFMSDGYK
ncbi:restriction endonuclease [Leptolyngbya sp. PL-A3]|uniref:restriction endonuclease n=1 Tax=Leptolyngbya sp. PL-A3 TaxID=2933911 RepID=UPI003298D985